MDDNSLFTIDTTEHVGDGNPIAPGDVWGLFRQLNGANRGASKYYMVYTNALLVRVPWC